MKRPLLALLLLTAGLAGCIGSEDTPAEPAASSGDDTEPNNPDAVLSIMDRGINPYHEVFRSNLSRASQHPATYLEDYPKTAERLNLTFGHETLEEAVEADCKQWSKVEPGQLYYVPGTRVVGLISPDVPWADDPPGADYECETSDTLPMFLEEGGHGTGAASRAVGAGTSQCPSCLVVAVESEGERSSAMAWTASQPFIDIQSNSWGYNPGPTPSVGENLSRMEQAASRQPAFTSSGNGYEATAVQWGQVPSFIRVGAHDNGNVTTWHGWRPHVVADACWVPVALHDTLTEVKEGAVGTSISAPYTAGIAAEIVRQARGILESDGTGVDEGVLAEGPQEMASSGPLADGEFTMQELQDVLFHTADPRPGEDPHGGAPCTLRTGPGDVDQRSLPVRWEDVPEAPAGIPLIGYGATTAETLQTAVDVLNGETPLPDRPLVDAFFDADHTTREITQTVWTASNQSPASIGEGMG